MSVIERLKQEYGIVAKAGEKITCPFCGHRTFQIKADDTIARCFHPTCEKYLTDRACGRNIKTHLFLVLENIVNDFHDELILLKDVPGQNAYRYVIRNRNVHPKILSESKLGVVPPDYNLKSKFDPLFKKLKKNQAKKSNSEIEKKKAKKKGESDNSDLKQLTTWYEKLKILVEGCTGWLCFFHTDSFGMTVAIRFRKPYTKKIYYFKPFKDVAGLFGCWDSHSIEDESTTFLKRLIVTEGEFNYLQLQSLLLRYGKATGGERLYLRVCSVGGVTNADFNTIKEIDSTPIICYDKDKDGAGFSLVEKARHEMHVTAFTTPEPGSDLDDFIRSHDKDYEGAWNSFLDLVDSRKNFPRYYQSVARMIFRIRDDKDHEGHSRSTKEFIIKKQVAWIIKKDMDERGKFYHDTYEAYFFMNGEKNLITLHLDFMDFRLLMSNYGLNPTETIYKYVAESLQIEAFKEGLKTEVHRFAFYNDAMYTLYFYNNGNQIYRITSDSVNLVDNGTDGVLFLKDAVTEPFLVHKPEDDLSLLDEYIISKMHFDKEILNEEEYNIVLSLWFYSVFFGSIMRTKPILALIGPKKSGKTSALAKIGVLLMGENFEVTPLSSDEKDFDAAVTNQYFVAIDNADSAIKWLNNRLATAATGGSIKKRELHTTNKLVEFPIKSYLAITSNSPKFRRDDVAERLLILKLERINQVISENKLRENILKNREKILSEIIYHHLPEIIKALKENPVSLDVGSFRMADFADFSLRVARYANIESTVKKILLKLSKQQSHFTLEYDTTFELLLEWIKKHHDREVRSVELHHELSDLASEKQIDFFYKDKSRAFAQHLRNIISNLSEFVKVEERMASGRKRLYRFAQKDDGENNE